MELKELTREEVKKLSYEDQGKYWKWWWTTPAGKELGQKIKEGHDQVEKSMKEMMRPSNRLSCRCCGRIHSRCGG